MLVVAPYFVPECRRYHSFTASDSVRVPTDKRRATSPMKYSLPPLLIATVTLLTLPACNMHREEEHHEAHRIVATQPQSTSVTLTQQYVCQIHSQRHIKVRALEMGYL